MPVKTTRQPITIDAVRAAYHQLRSEIRTRLSEFEAVGRDGDDERLWEEMVYCFFTGGCSASMGLRSVEAVRPLLKHGTQADLAAALTGVHRYPNARSRYIVESRRFLMSEGDLGLRRRLSEIKGHVERRDWLVEEKGIKGLGYKEASHFLRNVGYRGYAILDKHVLKCLAELKIIDDPKPPNSRSKYLTVEGKLRKLNEKTGIDFDELDLVLWSMKTGTILK